MIWQICDHSSLDQFCSDFSLTYVAHFISLGSTCVGYPNTFVQVDLPNMFNVVEPNLGSGRTSITVPFNAVGLDSVFSCKWYVVEHTETTGLVGFSVMAWWSDNCHAGLALSLHHTVYYLEQKGMREHNSVPLICVNGIKITDLLKS